MKSERIALWVLVTMTVIAIVAEISLCRTVDSILESINEGATIDVIEERIKKSKRLLSFMVSHEDLREVEVALCDYKSEASEINKSRLWDSVHHIKRLSFFSYFQRN